MCEHATMHKVLHPATLYPNLTLNKPPKPLKEAGSFQIKPTYKVNTLPHSSARLIILEKGERQGD